MKVIVTGASGFVGQHFVEVNKEKYQIQSVSLQNKEWEKTDFSNVDCIVHLAGKAHQMEPIEDAIYFNINTELTKQLYQKANVPHFIYISSTKVYGDGNYDYLDEKSDCKPTDAYGKSKLDAETFLLEQKTATAIVRPPLVYGKGVKGNMQKIVELCNKKSWLPFGNINNKRSMVYVGNLVALINTVIDKKATGVFVAGDVEPVSTTTLIETISNSINKKIKLLTIPNLFRKIIKILKPNLYIRLFGSFYVSNAETNKKLNFIPPYTFKQGINQMIK